MCKTRFLTITLLTGGTGNILHSIRSSGRWRTELFRPRRHERSHSRASHIPVPVLLGKHKRHRSTGRPDSRVDFLRTRARWTRRPVRVFRLLVTNRTPIIIGLQCLMRKRPNARLYFKDLKNVVLVLENDEKQRLFLARL